MQMIYVGNDFGVGVRVNDDVYELVKGVPWNIHRDSGNVITYRWKGVRGIKRLVDIVLPDAKGTIEHYDEDKTNCLRENLFVIRANGRTNKRIKRSNTGEKYITQFFQVLITGHGTRKMVGRFSDLAEAKKARNEWLEQNKRGDEVRK